MKYILMILLTSCSIDTYDQARSLQVQSNGFSAAHRLTDVACISDSLLGFAPRAQCEGVTDTNAKVKFVCSVSKCQ